MGSKSTYQKGVWAERFATFLLVCKGYRICKRRYKTHVGEIDIIAQRGKLFVFCEVKYRPSYDAGLFSISLESQRRIARAGTLFLAENGRGQDVNMRFDVVIISPPFYMKHLKNAWTL